jgi:hypothetical protein
MKVRYARRLTRAESRLVHSAIRKIRDYYRRERRIVSDRRLAKVLYLSYQEFRRLLYKRVIATKYTIKKIAGVPCLKRPLFSKLEKLAQRLPVAIKVRRWGGRTVRFELRQGRGYEYGAYKTNMTRNEAIRRRNEFLRDSRRYLFSREGRIIEVYKRTPLDISDYSSGAYMLSTVPRRGRYTVVAVVEVWVRLKREAMEHIKRVFYREGRYRTLFAHVNVSRDFPTGIGKFLVYQERQFLFTELPSRLSSRGFVVRRGEIDELFDLVKSELASSWKVPLRWLGVSFVAIPIRITGLYRSAIPKPLAVRRRKRRKVFATKTRRRDVRKMRRRGRRKGGRRKFKR